MSVLMKVAYKLFNFPQYLCHRPVFKINACNLYKPLTCTFILERNMRTYTAV